MDRDFNLGGKWFNVLSDYVMLAILTSPQGIRSDLELKMRQNDVYEALELHAHTKARFAPEIDNRRIVALGVIVNADQQGLQLWFFDDTGERATIDLKFHKDMTPHWEQVYQEMVDFMNSVNSTIPLLTKDEALARLSGAKFKLTMSYASA